MLCTYAEAQLCKDHCDVTAVKLMQTKQTNVTVGQETEVIFFFSLQDWVRTRTSSVAL